MNATRRTSLVAFLAIIPLAVMTGCSMSTQGAANPAAATAPSTSASASQSLPAPESVTVTRTDTTTTPPSATEPSSQEPSSQDPAPTGPVVQPTDLSGEVYGFIRAVDVARSELTLDKVDWFWGADAERACAVDSVSDEAHLNGWCSVYYFRNVNRKLRVVSVSPDAVITILEPTTPVNEDLQALADHAGTPGGEYYPYRITVKDGAIVELTQIYQP
jgi:hypothetical protein